MSNQNLDYADTLSRMLQRCDEHEQPALQAAIKALNNGRIRIPAGTLISVDVSKGDDDAQDRVFARATGEVMPYHEPVVLSIEEERNFGSDETKVVESAATSGARLTGTDGKDRYTAEPYAASFANGRQESGWCVKEGDDTVCDVYLGDEAMAKRLAALLNGKTPICLDVEALAQEIRRIDGRHSLGASALAEALVPFFDALLKKPA